MKTFQHFELSHDFLAFIFNVKKSNGHLHFNDRFCKELTF